MQQDKPIYGKTLADEIAMIILALISVFLIIYETRADLTVGEREMIRLVDMGIALVFLVEFGWRLRTAPAKKSFLKRHWWELLACVPVTAITPQALRAVPALRIFRLLGLLRFMRVMVRAREILAASEKFAAQTNLLHIVSVEIALSLAGALGFHYFEYGTNPNVTSFWDSYWWTWVTISTVGYGDIYPITVGGRIVAILLMVTGIGTLGVFVALVSNFFFRSKQNAS